MGVRTPNYIKKLFFDVSYEISNRNISINILKGRTNTISCGRTPHRVRELKLLAVGRSMKKHTTSHPSQGAGVEIHFYCSSFRRALRRTPHRVRELKL